MNKRLQKCFSEESKALTVEGIAEKVGISKNILYDWIRTDSELVETLERLNNIQEKDLYKTGTDEDSQVNAAMIAIVLMEAREQHYKRSYLLYLLRPLILKTYIIYLSLIFQRKRDDRMRTGPLNKLFDDFERKSEWQEEDQLVKSVSFRAKGDSGWRRSLFLTG